MTQIQAYENMSKEALLEHHLHTQQQHADDMDMLSKELASKSLTVPHGYRLVRLSDIDTAIQRASVFDGGGDGADPESARSCIAILRSMLKTDRIAPVAPQEPDQALLISMACCQHHGFGLLSKSQQDSMLQEMRKLWDEVMGHGYYSPSHRDRYTAMLAPTTEKSSVVHTQCNCPSGNGSLRWPCPVHPPETAKEVQP